MRKWSKVKDFDPNSQDPDSIPIRTDPEGGVIHGKGQLGGGSQRTPQIARMTTGSGTRSARYSIPSSGSMKQRIRG